MLISEEIKNKIYSEYNSFKETLYAGKTLEERKELDQFFTPPELTILMIEEFNCESLSGKIILDPTCGSGNMLAACLIAGADPDKLFGNDYDGDMVILCRDRLNIICKSLGIKGIEDYQIHQGNALQKLCLTKFDKEYLENYNVGEIDNLDYAQETLTAYSKENLW